MTQEEQTPLSPEAEARHTIDDLKGKLGNAEGALQEVNVHSRLVQSFASQGHPNPYDLATRAQSRFTEVTKDTTSDDLDTQTQQWFESERAMFGGSESSDEVPPGTPPSQPDTPLSETMPNLTSPGLAAKTVTVVVGSKEYFEQGWDKKSDAEQVAAMRGPTPTLVSPDKVQQQQRSVSPFGA